MNGACSTATLTPLSEYKDLGYCCGTLSLLNSQLRQSIATRIPKTHHPLPRPHKDRRGTGFLAAYVWSSPAFEGFLRYQHRTLQASPVISTKEEGTVLIQRAMLLARGQLHFWMKEPLNWSIICSATLKRLENLMSICTNKVQTVWVGSTVQSIWCQNT